MKIYIATPVNARNEATLEEKRLAAYYRMCEIRKELHKRLPKAEFHSSFDEHIAPINKELCKSEDCIMGDCVAEVMSCDVILMDDGWGDSHGCKVERYTAQEYGKEIWSLMDLEALKTK